jgi:hypothetical protein
VTEIKHTRGKVSLERVGNGGPNTQWKFEIEGQTGVPGVPTQTLIINEASVINDLKATIGQVEHAARSLGAQSTVDP